VTVQGRHAHHIACSVHKLGAPDAPEPVSQLGPRRRQLHSGQNHIRFLYSDTGLGYSDMGVPLSGPRGELVVVPLAWCPPLGMVPLANGEEGGLGLYFCHHWACDLSCDWAADFACDWACDFSCDFYCSWACDGFLGNDSLVQGKGFGCQGCLLVVYDTDRTSSCGLGSGVGAPWLAHREAKGAQEHKGDRH